MTTHFNTPAFPVPSAKELLPAIRDRLPDEVVGFAEYFLTYAPLATFWSADQAPYMVRVSLAQCAFTDLDVFGEWNADFERLASSESDPPPCPAARWSQAYRFDETDGWVPCDDVVGIVLEVFLPPDIPELGFWGVVTSSKGRQHTLGRYTGAELPIVMMEEDDATEMQWVTPLQEPAHLTLLSA